MCNDNSFTGSNLKVCPPLKKVTSIASINKNKYVVLVIFETLFGRIRELDGCCVEKQGYIGGVGDWYWIVGWRIVVGTTKKIGQG